MTTYLERVLDFALSMCCEHLNPDSPGVAKSVALAAAFDAVEKAPREGLTVGKTKVVVYVRTRDESENSGL